MAHVLNKWKNIRITLLRLVIMMLRIAVATRVVVLVIEIVK